MKTDTDYSGRPLPPYNPGDLSWAERRDDYVASRLDDGTFLDASTGDRYPQNANGEPDFDHPIK